MKNIASALPQTQAAEIEDIEEDLKQDDPDLATARRIIERHSETDQNNSEAAGSKV